MEDFVTYEQAFTLKKLGFKELCLYNYDIAKNLVPNSGIGDEDEGATTEDLLESYNFWEHERTDAPTLAQTQKWLRKEKNLIVESIASVFIPSGFDNVPFVWRIFDWNEPSNVIKVGKEHYKTPEEALSAGITECLKILEK